MHKYIRYYVFFIGDDKNVRMLAGPYIGKGSAIGKMDQIVGFEYRNSVWHSGWFLVFESKTCEIIAHVGVGRNVAIDYLPTVLRKAMKEGFEAHSLVA